VLAVGLAGHPYLRDEKQELNAAVITMSNMAAINLVFIV